MYIPELLKKLEEKPSVIIGVINRAIVERIFKQPELVLDKSGSELNGHFLEAIQSEDKAMTSENTRTDCTHHFQLAVNQTKFVNQTIAQPGT